MIIAKSVTKKISGLGKPMTILSNLSFNIKKGEFVVITGRSGSGKSTLLYILGLLDIVSSGKLIIEGVETNKLSENERSEFRLNNFGFIFQDYALMSKLSAMENVMMPLLMKGKTYPNAQKIAKRALIRVGLREKLNFLQSSLSGGQQQRVSIARSISTQPQVLFADEPTASLDSQSSLSVLNLLCKLNEKGVTVVLVTHEIEYAQLAKRIITLSDGEIISDKVL